MKTAKIIALTILAGSVIAAGLQYSDGLVSGSIRTSVYRATKSTNLTDNVATIICNIPLASGKQIGGKLLISAFVIDATPDYQEITYQTVFNAENKGGTLVASVVPNVNSGNRVTAGTISAATTTFVANGASFDVKVQVDTTLVPTNFICMWQLELNTTDTGDITPQ